MKKLFIAGFICFFSFIIFQQQVSAKVLRVYYFGNPVVGTDFATPQLAHDAATAGDTIEIYPNPGSNSVTCTKRLVWLGLGYFIDGTGNPGLQNFQIASNMLSINLGVGTDGSVISGINMANLTITGASNNHLIKRCNVTSILTFAANSSGVSLLQNYIAQVSSSTGVAVANINMSNNIFTSLVGLNAGSNSGLLSNNVFTTNTFALGTFIVQNNIMNTGATFTCSSCTILNNVGASTQFPVGNGNQQNVNMANVFVGTGTNDAKWKLKIGSPAIGAGQAGVDCGAFGGPDPYVLSGVPAIPSIYQLVAPGGTTVSGSTMNVSISTRGN